MSLLAVRGLRKSFGGIDALAGLSFEVAAGEIVALIGPNGAGKSTCFAVLGGQLAPDAGSVLLAGRDITGATPQRIARLGIARTFQIPAVFGSMTVRENVQTALLAGARRHWGALRRADALCAAEADALLAQVGMAAQAGRGVGVLAYGDLKRLELAVALAAAPRLLLMDEPTAGMAAAERIALMRLVRDAARARRVTVLFTEHDMGAVFGTAERILVLHRGALIASGDAAAVRADPQVRAVYLGDPAALSP